MAFYVVIQISLMRETREDLPPLAIHLHNRDRHPCKSILFRPEQHIAGRVVLLVLHYQPAQLNVEQEERKSIGVD